MKFIHQFSTRERFWVLLGCILFSCYPIVDVWLEENVGIGRFNDFDFIYIAAVFAGLFGPYLLLRTLSSHHMRNVALVDKMMFYVLIIPMALILSYIYYAKLRFMLWR